MEFYVYNLNLDVIGEISEYTTVEIERNYRTFSKLVLRVERNKRNIDLLKKGHILAEANTPSYGYYIDHFSSVYENNTRIIEVYAYSLNYFLSWRVVPKQQRYSGSVENIVKSFVRYNCIETIPNRVINSLEIGPNVGGFPSTQSTSTGKEVSEQCFNILNEYESSMDITIDLERKVYVFNVWRGVDRSTSQSANPRVMFSTEFDNVLTYEYFNNDIDLKNVVYVAGEGEGLSRQIVEIDNEMASGFNRREAYVDARDLQSEYQDENGSTINLTPSEYRNVLVNRGLEALAEKVSVESFESTVDDVQYIVGQDYFLGDLVTFYDEDLNVTINVRVNSIKIKSDSKITRYEPSFGSGIPNKLLGGK